MTKLLQREGESLKVVSNVYSSTDFLLLIRFMCIFITYYPNVRLFCFVCFRSNRRTLCVDDIFRRRRTDGRTRAERSGAERARMSFSARHAAKRGSNFAIAGALLTFCGGAYWYTMTKVRKDEVDAAIERREQQQKQRGR